MKKILLVLPITLLISQHSYADAQTTSTNNCGAVCVHVCGIDSNGNQGWNVCLPDGKGACSVGCKNSNNKQTITNNIITQKVSNIAEKTTTNKVIFKRK